MGARAPGAAGARARAPARVTATAAPRATALSSPFVLVVICASHASPDLAARGPPMAAQRPLMRHG
eukprot:8571264-Pyramimonas_sp.AAC.1